MELEVDRPRASPVPPGLLQYRGEPGLQGLEPEDDEGPVVDVVPGAEGTVGLDALYLFVQTCKNRTTI